MKWYNKFNVGQKVRVIRKISYWSFPNGGRCSWVNSMDTTIGRAYKIEQIRTDAGYLLNTHNEVISNYWYPMESLASVKGEQLMFNFMNKY